MKTHLSNALVILIVSVAVGANAVPPVTNSGTATTETTGGAFIPPPVGGGFLAQMTPGSASVNGNPGGSGETLGASGGGGVQSGVIVADTARLRLLDTPPYYSQNLPFTSEIPAAARPLSSNATPTALARRLEERELARIDRLVREGGLGPARQSERRWTQSFQPDVSFSGDQINILKTFLQ